jgi:Leucine-rich repeat (LRR) protein
VSDADKAYAAAVEAIREAKANGIKALSLNRWEALAELPPEIGDLSSLEELILEDTKVADLRPIQELIGLKKLVLSGCQKVTDLSPLISLTNLLELELYQTRPADFSPLENLGKLQFLGLAFSQARDISFLGALGEIKHLFLNGLPVGKLESIQHLVKLETLNLQFSGINTDISRVKGFHRLREFSIDETHVSDISPLRDLIELQTLTFCGTPVADISPLQNLSKLRRLDFRRTQVHNLSPLRGLSQLHMLNLSGTPVTSIGPLKDLTNIYYLSLDGTKIDSLMPLQGHRTLRHLNIEGTQVADLSPIATLPAPLTLTIDNSAVSDLRPVAPMNNLIPKPRGGGGGISYKGIPACQLDPEGLGKLAEITDHEDRTRKTLAYLQSLTEWPPRGSEVIEQAMQGPILASSIADIALIESRFEAVSPDPPLPEERDQDYFDLVDTLKHAASQIASS